MGDLAIRDDHPEVNPLAIMPAMDLQMALQRRSQMVAFVTNIMAEGVDFGVIPGTDKPTLLKPGAEKLTTFFGLSKRFRILEKIEDWTGVDHGGEPFFYYLYRCRLYRGDLLVAEADASANAWESKYRYRWVPEDEVPAHLNKSALLKRAGKLVEYDFAVEREETAGKYGKPAAYWQQFRDAIAAGTAKRVTRTTNSGKDLAAWEIGSIVYQVPNTDMAGQVNTLQKMAQKRALVAATLLAVNASEFFTQDLEDTVIEGTYQTVSEPPAPAPARKAQPPAPAGNGKPKQSYGRDWPARPWDAETLRRYMQQRVGDDPAPPNDEQFRRMHAAMHTLTLGDDNKRLRIQEYLFGVESSTRLSAGQVDALYRWIGTTKAETGEWVPNGYAIEEARAVVKAHEVESGQTNMFEGAGETEEETT